MCSVDSRFTRRFGEVSFAFVPFTILGYPDPETSLKLMTAMIEGGAHALELGIAFSDPCADGPTIQNAATETIATGFSTKQALELVRRLRHLDSDIPVTLLVYYNTICAYGKEKFLSDAKSCGVDGITIVDLPPETDPEISTLFKKNKLARIFIVSPLTDDKRLDAILTNAEGFLYLVSRLGITGTASKYDAALPCTIERIKSRTNLPLCVGFGISSPENARTMRDSGADGVITGSAILELCARQNFDSSAVRDYVRSMASSG